MSVSTSSPTGVWRPPPQGEWTYDDYLQLPDNGFRYEILDGDLHMSPAPAPRHQLLILRLGGAILRHLELNNAGRAFPAPVDVRLDENVLVQPDLVVVLNAKLPNVSEREITGPPDLLIEVISPSSVVVDRRRKFDLYASYKVREYWLIDLEEHVIEINVLRGEAYSLLAKFTRGQRLVSEVLPGLEIDPADVFAA